jgi:hypothetical protein
MTDFKEISNEQDLKIESNIKKETKLSECEAKINLILPLFQDEQHQYLKVKQFNLRCQMKKIYQKIYLNLCVPYSQFVLSQKEKPINSKQLSFCIKTLPLLNFLQKECSQIQVLWIYISIIKKIAKILSILIEFQIINSKLYEFISSYSVFFK